METEAEIAYQDCYSYEVELNETFNRFASNFCLAYQGPNTASAQIKAKVDPKLSKSTKCYSIFVVSNNNILFSLSSPEYSDLDDELKKRGDEYLPLGPSFQDHVECFVK